MAERPRASGHVVFVGPFPDPVHGQSVATRDLHDELRAGGFTVRKVNTAGRAGRRLFSALNAVSVLLSYRSAPAYLSVNANWGIWLTGLFALTARLRARAIMLHHHSFRYIAQHDRGMTFLAAAAGADAVHVTNCEAMSASLEEAYAGVRRTLAYSNVASVRMEPAERAANRESVVLGHLSNLTLDKGIGRVIGAFRAARQQFPRCRLHVAGPCAEAAAGALIEAAKAEFGTDFVYHGPVLGAAKQAFFRDVDIFLFPSLYPVETQGIVNLEALAAGCPVLAFAQCCIAGDIGETGGIAIAKTQDFTAAVLDYIPRFVANRVDAGAKARQRFRDLLASHQTQQQAVFASLRNGARLDTSKEAFGEP